MIKYISILFLCCLQVGLQANTNLPPWSPPAPLLEEGQTWEDWTNSVEYTAIAARSSETNVIIRHTGDNTNPPPDILYAPLEPGGFLVKQKNTIRVRMIFIEPDRPALAGTASFTIEADVPPEWVFNKFKGKVFAGYYIED